MAGQYRLRERVGHLHRTRPLTQAVLTPVSVRHSLFLLWRPYSETLL